MYQLEFRRAEGGERFQPFILPPAMPVELRDNELTLVYDWNALSAQYLVPRYYPKFGSGAAEVRVTTRQKYLVKQSAWAPVP